MSTPPASASARQAAGMLVLATVLWGLSFPLGKNWQNAAEAFPGGAVPASLALIATRVAIALPVFALLAPHLFSRPGRRAHLLGLLLGCMNSLGVALQVVGLAWTTPALSSFYTSLASAWVPVVAFLWFRLSVRAATLVGLALGLCGAGVLGVKPDAGWSMGAGDALTVLSTFVFAVMIVLIDRLGRTVPPGHTTVGFLLGTGVPAALAATIWGAASGSGANSWLQGIQEMLAQPAVLRDVVALSLCSTVAASYVLMVYQPRVSAGQAALIYLLEPLFATAFSILWGHDVLTGRLIVGGVLILGGNMLVELPVWLREWARRRTPHESEAFSGGTGISACAGQVQAEMPVPPERDKIEGV